MTAHALLIHATPPPPPPEESRFHYSGTAGGSEPLSTREIAARMVAEPAGRHLVWRAGFDGWQRAQEQPEISALLNTPPPLPEATE